MSAAGSPSLNSHVSAYLSDRRKLESLFIPSVDGMTYLSERVVVYSYPRVSYINNSLRGTCETL
jgi:hypothetical protein